MSEEPVTVDGAIAFLNKLLEIDPEAVRALFAHRVRCNKLLADHPSVQVGAGPREGYANSSDPSLGPGEYDVGILGLLNGLFGVDERGWGYIAAYFEDDGTLTGFTRIPLAATPPEVYPAGPDKP